MRNNSLPTLNRHPRGRLCTTIFALSTIPVIINHVLLAQRASTSTHTLYAVPTLNTSLKRGKAKKLRIMMNRAIAKFGADMSL